MLHDSSLMAVPDCKEQRDEGRDNLPVEGEPVQATLIHNAQDMHH